MRSGKISVSRAKITCFRALPLGVCVPTSSPKYTVLERITFLFRDQLVPFSSPHCANFVPEPCIFRALFVLLSSSVHAVIEPFRAVSIRALAVKYVARQNLAIFFTRSVSASITVLLRQV